MIPKISSWAQGIIIAVIIGTIIQIILPESKNKKYIKVVIGIYVLFCILNPVIGKSINLNEYNLEKYMNNTSSKTNITSNYDTSVKNIFKEKTITAIKQKMNSEGYDSENISIDVTDEYKITYIRISSIYEYSNTTKVSVNKIEINIKDTLAKGIATSDKNDLIEYLKETYNLKKENIDIE